jgi:hypothetical protein
LPTPRLNHHSDSGITPIVENLPMKSLASYLQLFALSHSVPCSTTFIFLPTLCTFFFSLPPDFPFVSLDRYRFIESIGEVPRSLLPSFNLSFPVSCQVFPHFLLSSITWLYLLFLCRVLHLNYISSSIFAIPVPIIQLTRQEHIIVSFSNSFN